MSRNKKPRKAYRPRQIAVNTLQVALWRAAQQETLAQGNTVTLARDLERLAA